MRNTQNKNIKKFNNKQIPAKKLIYDQTYSPKKDNRGKSLMSQSKRKKTIQIKTEFQINPLHMCLLMQEQRSQQIKAIKSHPALKLYYEALMRLFSIVYSASQIIISNIFDCHKTTSGLAGPGILGAFIAVAEHSLHQQKMLKLKIMAKNIIKMAHSLSEFERKIEFACRKIALNINIRKQVEFAFISIQITNFWQSLLLILQKRQQVQFLQEMFQLPPEKLAYWHFMSFLNRYVCQQQFYVDNKMLKKVSQDEELDEADQICQFTFQFKIIELFCFNDQLVRPRKDQKQNECQIF